MTGPNPSGRSLDDLVKVWQQVEVREVVCPTCSGPLAQQKIGPFQIWSPAQCARCEAAQDTATRLAEVARQQAAALERLAPPYEYRHAALENFLLHGPPEAQAAQQRLKAKAEVFAAQLASDPRNAPPLVVLCGGTGTGKTHLAWALAILAVTVANLPAKVWKFPKALRYLHGTWGGGDGDTTPEWRRWDEMHKPTLLVLDEVSSHAVNQKNLSATLYEILAVRAEERRPTILTTNETREELGQLLGAPLVSRIGEHHGFWDAGTRDFRLEERAMQRRRGGAA